MKRRIKLKKWLIGGLVTGAVATTPLVVVSCSSSDSNKNNDNNQQNNANNQKIVSNYQEFTNGAKPSELTIFKTDKPWISIDPDPQNALFDSIYQKINLDVIKNDIKLFIADIVSTNKMISLNISQMDVNQNDDGTYSVNIDMKIQNNFNFRRKLLFFNGQKDLSMKLAPNQITNIKININNATITKAMYIRSENAFINYGFSKLSLDVDGSIKQYDSFPLQFYSKTLNTKITNLNTLKQYDDISNDGNQYLSSLNIKTIEDQMFHKIDTTQEDLVAIISYGQNILLNLIKPNQNVLGLLSDSSEDIYNLIGVFVKEDIYKELKPIIIAVLKNEKLLDIVRNNKDLIKNLIDKYLPSDFQSIANQIIDGITNSDNIDAILEIINDPNVKETLIQMLGEKLTNKLIEQLNNINNIGILTFIISLYDEIKEFLNTSTIEKIVEINNKLTPLYPILDKVVDGILNNKPIFDLLVDIIKTTKKDENGKDVYILRELLASKLSPNIINILDMFIFNNENFNSENLKLIIKCIAEPKTSDQPDAQLVKLGDWIKTVDIKKTKSESNAYDNKTFEVNLNNSIRYTFKQDLYFYTGDLIKILPKSIVDKIPSSLININEVFPKYIGVKADDYIDVNIKNTDNNKLTYDVDNIKNKNYLNWKMDVENVIDVNLPQTLGIIGKNSILSFTVSNVTNLPRILKNTLYRQYNKFGSFKPFSSTNNPSVEGYDINTFNNQAVILKQNVDYKKIKDELIKKSKLVNIPNTEKSVTYKYKNILGKVKESTEKVSKVKVDISKFDLQPILDQIFDFSNLKTKFNAYLEIDKSLVSINVLGLGVDVSNVSLILDLPCNVYYNGVATNVIKLAL